MFEQMEKEIRDEYKRKLEALYTLYPEFSASNNLNGEASSGVSRGSIAKIVRNLIDIHAGEKFTQGQMSKWLFEADPTFASSLRPVAVPNTLARMASNGEIEKVSPEGERPAIYKAKTKHPAN